MWSTQTCVFNWLSMQGWGSESADSVSKHSLNRLRDPVPDGPVPEDAGTWGSGTWGSGTRGSGAWGSGTWGRYTSPFFATFYTPSPMSTLFHTYHSVITLFSIFYSSPPPYVLYGRPLQNTLVPTALYLTRHMNMEWLTDFPEFGGSQCKNIPTILFLCQVISFAKLHNKLFTTIFVFTLK